MMDCELPKVSELVHASTVEVGGAVVSVCQIEIIDGIFNLSVSTISEHQGRGYAKDCVNRAVSWWMLSPLSDTKTLHYWARTCNIPSTRVAESCGFEKREDDRYHGWAHYTLGSCEHDNFQLLEVPLDVDGKPIKLGDEVWFKPGYMHECMHTVAGIQYTMEGDIRIALYSMFGLYSPDLLTHKKPKEKLKPCPKCGNENVVGRVCGGEAAYGCGEYTYEVECPCGILFTSIHEAETAEEAEELGIAGWNDMRMVK